MKKQILLITLIVIVAVIITISMFLKEPKVGTFELSDYQYYIDNFPSEEIISNTSDLREVMVKVEKLWIELYGESVKKEKPYKIFYDSDNDVWLFQGSLRSDMMGGVANILIEKSTGKILAIWHDK